MLIIVVVLFLFFAYHFFSGGIGGKVGLNLPKGVPSEVGEKYRHEMLAQLASADNTGKYSTPAFLTPTERLIFAVPVTLSEDHVVGRRGSGASVRIMKGVWLHGGGSQSVSQLSPTDSGTLTLTDKRFIFNGRVKSMEFPFTKITQFSTSLEGIALASPSHKKVAYFTDIWKSVKLETVISPEAGDTWQAGPISFPLTGPDIREIVGLLQKS